MKTNKPNDSTQTYMHNVYILMKRKTESAAKKPLSNLMLSPLPPPSLSLKIKEEK